MRFTVNQANVKSDDTSYSVTHCDDTRKHEWRIAWNKDGGISRWLCGICRSEIVV